MGNLKKSRWVFGGTALILFQNSSGYLSCATSFDKSIELIGSYQPVFAPFAGDTFAYKFITSVKEEVTQALSGGLLKVRSFDPVES